MARFFCVGSGFKCLLSSVSFGYLLDISYKLHARIHWIFELVNKVKVYYNLFIN